METQINKTIWFVAVTLLFVIGANATTLVQQNQTTMSTPQISSQPLHQANLFPVKELKGSEVKSISSMNSQQNKAEKIGTVKEVVINDNQNRIEYIIVNSGGKLYPVPWSAFNVQGLARNASEQAMKTNTGTSENIGQGMYQTSLEPATQIPVSTNRKLTLYLDMTKNQLQSAPKISSVSTKNFSEPSMRKEIDSFYSKLNLFLISGKLR